MLRFVCYLLYKEGGAGNPVRLALASGRGRGNAPPLRGGGFCVLRQPQISPSSVTCGDSFPHRGKPHRRGGGFCMLRHSPVVIGGTICRESRAIGVVIYSTIRGIGVVIGSTVSGLLFTAQFGFAARGLLFPTQFKTVVIHGTFPLFAQKIGLLSAAQLRVGLLFSAQFGGVVKHSTIAAACRLTAF